MNKWRELVRREIDGLTHGRAGSVFTRQALLAHSLEAFRAEFPEAKTPGQTLSRELQELRDEGILEFVAVGEYRLMVGSSRDETVSYPPPVPGRRPGTVNVRLAEVKTRPYQRWLRSHVLPNFNHSCAVCGLTPEWFLDAAHLRPASRYLDLAGDPCAAVALCKNHHKAMDTGAFVINEELRVEVDRTRAAGRGKELEHVLFQYDGVRIRKPKNWRLNEVALPSEPVRNAESRLK